MKTVSELTHELALLRSEVADRERRGLPESDWFRNVIARHEEELARRVAELPGEDLTEESGGTYGGIPWWGWALVSVVSLLWVLWAV